MKGIKALAAAIVLGVSLAAPAHATLDADTSAALDKALAGDHRSDANKARDTYRNPKETLTFFGLKRDMTVVEIWPGGGWYTEVLAPTLKGNGTYVAATLPRGPEASDGAKRGNARFDEKMAGRPDLYGEVKKVGFGSKELELAPAGTVDMVLTFRNVHNWMGGGWAEPAFASMFAALKPGGVLGVVEHRANTDTPQDPKAANGYVREDHVIALAEKAGFKFVGKSEINANPKDTKDYAKGVWTLPPVLTEGEANRDKYLAIGESDRMTLKFVKPAN